MVEQKIGHKVASFLGIVINGLALGDQSGTYLASRSTFAIALGLVVLAAAIACWVPAYRAAKVDPMVALVRMIRVRRTK